MTSSALLTLRDTSLVYRAMRVLTPQEKAVVCYRFGLRDGYSRTLQEVGSILKISRERVRQVENQAKRRLRRVFSGMRTIRSLPKSPGLHGHTARDRTPGTALSRALSSNGTKTLVGQ